MTAGQPAVMTRASTTETLRTLTTVLVPTLAGGLIKRRPRVMGLLSRIGADNAAIHEVARLRARHGDEPLPLRLPGRSVALILSPDDVGRLLAETPDPYHPASTDKITALAHFQPHASLITRDLPARERRRAANEQALDTGRPLHHLAAPIHRVIREEAATLPADLDWPAFDAVWQRIVRRIVLGTEARHDRHLTELLDRLRRNANWARAHPLRHRLRDEFTERLRRHVRRAEPDTLAAAFPADADPVAQVPHWLFAFDAVGMVIMRTLAVLATHPSDRVEPLTDEPAQLPYLRACVLDTVRLWPTTPAILREDAGGTTFVIYTPYFHRLESARFDPDQWLDGRARQNPALVPFSAGPGECPGQNVVLFTASTMLAAMSAYRLSNDPGLSRDPLPATLDNFALRFRAAPPG